jgi:phosphoserine phosphatase
VEKNSHFKLAIFDLDGTLTQERSIWEYVHRKLGKWDGFADAFQTRFLAGEISYEHFCELDAQVWKGMRAEEILGIAKTVAFHSGADQLINYFKQKGLKLAIISSGLSILSDWVHEKYGFDYSVSNELMRDNGILTGKVNVRVYFDRKGTWVTRILERFGVRPEEAIAIGDSMGDLEMLRMAGFSVAFNSSCPELDESAHVCIKSQNLADLIPLLPF